MSEPPVRICCGERHYGVMCRNGTVMCCLCFGKFTIDQLARDQGGDKVDICLPCWLDDQRKAGQR